MFRFGLILAVGASGVAAVVMTASGNANPPAAADAGLQNSLLIQRTMGHAKEFLLQARPRKAVELLEENVSRINGNANYLALLRDAYRAYIRDLWLENQPVLAKRYLDRLTILDPKAAEDPTLQPENVQSQNAREAAPPAAAAAPQAAAPPKGYYPAAQPRPAAPVLASVVSTNAPAPGKAPATVRAKVEDDPFDRVYELARAPEKAAGPSARDLVDRAEAEFGRRDYAKALLLYEQAAGVDPKAVEGSRDRWGYCKLNRVVDQLNGNRMTADTAPELQKEVQVAMALAPGLAKTGQWLLQEIETRRRTPDPAAAPAAGDEVQVHVQHLGQNAQGWQVAETPHFRIFHRQPRDFAERAAQVAERTRLLMYRKWFGADGPAWAPKCDLFLHPTAQDYSQATGVTMGSPGHSRIETDGNARVIGRRMDLHCENPSMLQAVLPHETTHVVLAGQFGNFQVPRWVDEGIAVLAEPAEKVEQHRRNLLRCYKDGQLFPVRDLVHLQDYPQPRLISAFYAQSVFLVDFLARQKGPAVFSQFVRDGLREGYEAALRKHYGLNNLNELQDRWTQFLVAEVHRATPAVAAER